MTPQTAAYTTGIGFIVLALAATALFYGTGWKRLAQIALVIGFAAFAIGGTVQHHHYRHGPAPADWIAAEVRDVDDPIVRQDVRTALADRAAQGETISRTTVEDEVERQRALARQQRAAQAQKGALK